MRQKGSGEEIRSNVLQAIRDMAVTIAIDDIGTGTGAPHSVTYR
jgi:EAL domain-containing protein (putative c-di-GMP-specific phosphodiesterase class I)